MQQFLRPMQQALSCVTHVHVYAGQGEGDNASAMRLQTRWAALKGPHRLALEFFHTYTVSEESGGWSVHSSAYRYQVRQDEQQEILAYHWHPAFHPAPHLHLKTLREPAWLASQNVHIPTGRVSIEMLIRFLISDLSVEPQRADWQTVLDGNEADFVREQTWGVVPPG